MSLIDKPERARQLARAIATDFIVHHEKEIREGISNDNFFEALHKLLEEGRERFLKRIDPSLGTSIYDEAIVDVVIKSQGEVPSPLW